MTNISESVIKKLIQHKIQKNSTFPFDLNALWKNCQKLVEANKGNDTPHFLGYLTDEATNEKIKVFSVDADHVKKTYFMDFVEGGNEQVYHFIHNDADSDGTLWVDAGISNTEKPHIILHEYTERFLMKHKKLSYAKAHKKANEEEIQVLR